MFHQRSELHWALKLTWLDCFLSISVKISLNASTCPRGVSLGFDQKKIQIQTFLNFNMSDCMKAILSGKKHQKQHLVEKCREHMRTLSLQSTIVRKTIQMTSNDPLKAHRWCSPPAGPLHEFAWSSPHLCLPLRFLLLSNRIHLGLTYAGHTE